MLRVGKYLCLFQIEEGGHILQRFAQLLVFLGVFLWGGFLGFFRR